MQSGSEIDLVPYVLGGLFLLLFIVAVATGIYNFRLLKSMKKCHWCKTLMQGDATVCAACKREQPPV